MRRNLRPGRPGGLELLVERAGPEARLGASRQSPILARGAGREPRARVSASPRLC